MGSAREASRVEGGKMVSRLLRVHCPLFNSWEKDVFCLGNPKINVEEEFGGLCAYIINKMAARFWAQHIQSSVRHLPNQRRLLRP